MTPEMRRITDGYLARLRRSLRGVAPDVSEEIVCEIRAHIDDALAARGQDTVGALLDVLDRLGPPEDYGRDLGLYMMVDRGYREWSVPHMVRSTAFWALSTVAGALVVMIFGLIYFLLLGVVTAGLQRLLAPALVLPLPRVLPAVPPAALVVVGVLAMAGTTAMVRWFIGQYVVSARPHTLGGSEADSGWVQRTSRRIITLAVIGVVVMVVAGLAGRVFRLAPPYTFDLPDDFFQAPMGVVSFGGLLVLLLSPVLGLLWTAVTEHQGR